MNILPTGQREQPHITFCNSKRKYLAAVGQKNKIGGIVVRAMVGEGRDRPQVMLDNWSGSTIDLRENYHLDFVNVVIQDPIG